jgi:hypothetical protein
MIEEAIGLPASLRLSVGRFFAHRYHDIDLNRLGSPGGHNELSVMDTRCELPGNLHLDAIPGEC